MPIHRRMRSGSVNRAKVCSASSGTSTDFSIVIGVSSLGWFGSGKLFELPRPERIERSAQRRHPGRIEAVVAKATVPSHVDKSGGGQHTQVLGDGGPRYLELGGQFGDRLLPRPQEFQQAP